MINYISLILALFFNCKINPPCNLTYSVILTPQNKTHILQNIANKERTLKYL